MADADQLPNLLADLLDGRTVTSGAGGEAAALAMLARRCQRLAVPEPSAASEVRGRLRFVALLDGGRAGRSPWAGWFGAGAARPLHQRVAAASLLVVALGGGASVATGVSPAEFAAGAGDFVRSVIVNLDPREGGPSDRGSIPPRPSPPAPTVSSASGNPPPFATTLTPDNATAAPSASGVPSSGTASSTARIGGTPPGGAASSSPSVPPPTATSTQTPPGGQPASPSVPPSATSTPTPPRGTSTPAPTPSGTPDDRGGRGSKTPDPTPSGVPN